MPQEVSQLQRLFNLLKPCPVYRLDMRTPSFPLARTFWCWVWQILQGNTSCREVLRQFQALLSLLEEPPINEDSSAYCQARAAVPQALL